jgi:cytochrome oxidase assembly protein ShyY1
MADYRFARQPKWIAGHLLALFLLVLFINLGLWQLRRLDERRDTNALVEHRSQLAPEPVGDLVDPDSDHGATDDIRFRAVSATGTYTGDTISVRSTQDGVSGGRIFSVIDLGGGETVAVLRGFAGLQDDGSVIEPPTPGGEVTVDGIAYPTRRLEPVSRQALGDLPPADAGTLLPVIVQADDADSPDLTPVPRPDLGEGPHFSYAVQWFLFAAVGLVGYPLLLRKRAGEAPDDEPDAD